jgi:hypothetical protein
MPRPSLLLLPVLLLLLALSLLGIVSSFQPSPSIRRVFSFLVLMSVCLSVCLCD